MKKELLCPVCGDNYREGDKFCPGCGAKLKGVLKEHSKSSNCKPEKNGNSVSEKQNLVLRLSSNNMIQLAVFLVLLVFVNLYLSGVFDEPVAGTVTSTAVQNDPHQGIDMSKLEEIKSIEDKLALNPNDYESFRHLLHLLKESGLVQKTVDKYEEYISLQPDDYETLLEFCHFLHDNNQWAKAVYYYDIYLKKFPANPDVLVDQGVCYFSQKDYKNAIRVMEKALDYDKKHLFANFNLGIVNLNAGNVEKGKEWMKKVVEIDPNSQMGQQAQEIINNN